MVVGDIDNGWWQPRDDSQSDGRTEWAAYAARNVDCRSYAHRVQTFVRLKATPLRVWILRVVVVCVPACCVCEGVLPRDEFQRGHTIPTLREAGFIARRCTDIDCRMAPLARARGALFVFGVGVLAVRIVGVPRRH